MQLIKSLLVGGGAAALLIACASSPPPASTSTQGDVHLRVNVFAGSTNLPLLVAIDKGFLRERKISVAIQNTPDSDQQRAGLAAGRFEIAHAAVDNALALVEAAKEDVIIVSGGDGSMNEFIARGEINGITGMRGKVLAVDAPNTAYGLAAKKILKNNGLIEGRDYTVRAVLPITTCPSSANRRRLNKIPICAFPGATQSTQEA